MARWAPLRVPWHRRVETCAVVLALLLPLACLLLLLACAFLSSLSRAVLAAYLLWWAILDRATPCHGGRPIGWLRRLPLWRHVRAYFPARLHVVSPLAARPHVIAVHPHGIISVGVAVNLAMTPHDPAAALGGGVDYRIITVSANMRMPLWRELAMGLGYVDASRDSVDAALGSGLSVVVVVGGALESLMSQPNSADLALASRHGFVRMALRHGAPLVPAYSFGEVDCYSQVANPPGSRLRAFQDALLRAAGFTIPLFWGRGVLTYDSGVLPRRVPVTTVVGTPIAVPHVPDPSPSEIAAWHAVYVAALTALYDEHAPRLHSPEALARAGVPAPPRPAPLRVVK